MGNPQLKPQNRGGARRHGVALRRSAGRALHAEHVGSLGRQDLVSSAGRVSYCSAESTPDAGCTP